jgi:hypothetical protein
MFWLHDWLLSRRILNYGIILFTAIINTNSDGFLWLSAIPPLHIQNKSLEIWELTYGTMSYSFRGKVVHVRTNSAPCYEDVWGSGCIGPHILELYTTWRWIISLTLRPLYSSGKEPPVPIGYEAGCDPEPAWTAWRTKSCSYRDSNSDRSAVQPVASRYTECTIPALILMYNIVEYVLYESQILRVQNSY